MPPAPQVTPVIGLSPRVRGSHHRGRPRLEQRGSIPACAGEPAALDGVSAKAAVYPRVCGGAADVYGAVATQTGLSPRVRGSRDATRRGGERAGSIPACAGEPRPSAVRTRWARVYPRVCGGANVGLFIPETGDGLSPRVRGSPLSIPRSKKQARSIPACAGEPSEADSWDQARAVYPRVCGGAFLRPRCTASTTGLSPRVRGSPSMGVAAPANAGSIPACAGEPSFRPTQRRPSPVYPRVCGGA